MIKEIDNTRGEKIKEDVKNVEWSNTVLATGILPLLNVIILTYLGSLMGLVIYTGHDTRSALVLHTSTPRVKVSSINSFKFFEFL